MSTESWVWETNPLGNRNHVWGFAPNTVSYEHRKLSLGDKFLAAPGNRTHVWGFAPTLYQLSYRDLLGVGGGGRGGGGGIRHSCCGHLTYSFDGISHKYLIPHTLSPDCQLKTASTGNKNSRFCLVFHLYIWPPLFLYLSCLFLGRRRKWFLYLRCLYLSCLFVGMRRRFFLYLRCSYLRCLFVGRRRRWFCTLDVCTLDVCTLDVRTLDVCS